MDKNNDTVVDTATRSASSSISSSSVNNNDNNNKKRSTSSSNTNLVNYEQKIMTATISNNDNNNNNDQEGGGRINWTNVNNDMIMLDPTWHHLQKIYVSYIREFVDQFIESKKSLTQILFFVLGDNFMECEYPDIVKNVDELKLYLGPNKTTWENVINEIDEKLMFFMKINTGYDCKQFTNMQEYQNFLQVVKNVYNKRVYELKKNNHNNNNHNNNHIKTNNKKAPLWDKWGPYLINIIDKRFKDDKFGRIIQPEIENAIFTMNNTNNNKKKKKKNMTTIPVFDPTLSESVNKQVYSILTLISGRSLPNTFRKRLYTYDTRK